MPVPFLIGASDPHPWGAARSCPRLRRDEGNGLTRPDPQFCGRRPSVERQRAQPVRVHDHHEFTGPGVGESVHPAGPALVVATWAIFGPRGWFKPSHIVTALAIPIEWLLYSLLRGAVIGAYPYPFVDVLEYGYGPVLTTVAMIVAFGMFLGALFFGLDRLLGRFVGAGASGRVA